MAAFGHAWQALEPKRKHSTAFSYRRGFAAMAVILAIAALFVPIRLSVLAQAEIIALDALAISSPMDGVIKNFSVQPNQPVVQDQLLFTLDETTLRNRA